MPSQAAVRHASTACTGTQRLWRYLCPSVVHSARRLLCGERLARACCRLLHIAPGGPEEWCASWWLAALPMCCLQRKFTRGPLGYGKRESERAKGAYKDRAGRAFHIVTTTVVSRLHLPVNGSSLDISMSLLQRLPMSHTMAVMALSAGRRINRHQTNRWIPHLTLHARKRAVVHGTKCVLQCLHFSITRHLIVGSAHEKVASPLCLMQDFRIVHSKYWFCATHCSQVMHAALGLSAALYLLQSTWLLRPNVKNP